MLLDCATGLMRMQNVEYICAEIHRLSEFMHLLVISSEYRATRMIELSLEEMIRVQEQPRVVSSDRSIIPLPVFEIEYYNIFVDFTRISMYSTFHSEGISQRVVWDPGIEGSIHDWVVRRHGLIQWFIWDPGISVWMHFSVDSCRLLEEKQSLVREDSNVPLLINRGLTEDI